MAETEAPSQLTQDSGKLALWTPLECLMELWLVENGWMLREYDEPPQQTIGEPVELFRQLFEVIHFMHEHHMARRYVTNENLIDV
ncbi:hypothetical protein PHLCEN_2v9237 [Hermanssonia centrifuga]|uniref:Uncharacterized protein n=1 Tax=Hermanssonia centrifuga TaxID=98765 RepID=A0A2R6NRF1_9APHY|nr:hypothetical protein PHLCEN_2v9237 [Hermanssonia centrifuga]